MADIMSIQKRFQDAGFQWRETIFNDGHSDNCAISFTVSKNPCYLSQRGGDVGWGRYPRARCWINADQWLDKVEANLKEIPEPRTP